MLPPYLHHPCETFPASDCSPLPFTPQPQLEPPLSFITSFRRASSKRHRKDSELCHANCSLTDRRVQSELALEAFVVAFQCGFTSAQQVLIASTCASTESRLTLNALHYWTAITLTLRCFDNAPGSCFDTSYFVRTER